MYAVVPTGDNQAASTLLLLLLPRQDVLHRLLDIGVVLSRLGGSLGTLWGLHELYDAARDRVHVARTEPALALRLSLSLSPTLGYVQQPPRRRRRRRGGHRVCGQVGERRGLGNVNVAVNGFVARRWGRSLPT
jgi:hypothetical protein